MKRALFVIDYQYDFVADDGILTVGKPAQAIERIISEIAMEYETDDIYFTFDDHTENDWKERINPETEVFPMHCIKGEKGAGLFGAIKGCDNEKNYVFKRAYCPDFDFLTRAVQKYDEITVTGVVTDICVFQTVLGLFTAAANLGKQLKITVPSAACASFNADREQWALKYMSEVLSVNVK